MNTAKTSAYIAKAPNKQGIVDYSDTENEVWRDLYAAQINLIQGRACEEYIHGLEWLQLSQDRIPQIPEVNEALTPITGWTLEPVPALIPFDRFFSLLANRQFPAATFIRHREELHYLKEPDMFHEVFGHCPLLTNPIYADFMQAVGEIGLDLGDKQRLLLARLYWFTVEFGLIQNQPGLRAFGGGILSSIKETVYAVESETPFRKTFDPLIALRTPYRIDHLQPIYFVIENFKTLYDLVTHDLAERINEAASLGDFLPVYESRS